MSPLPLRGITVVSLEQAVAAPFATRQLADLGARVIKIERPGAGDFARGYDETVLGQSSYFVWLNRSKESLALDLKSTAGREILHELLSAADVFVHNLGPGAVQRMGLHADALEPKYPRLISAEITGFGSSGPWSDRKAYDLLVQAECGLVSITGTENDVAKTAISIADIAAGMYLFSGIQTALYCRATTGETHHVSVSLFEALAEWMGSPAYYAAYGGTAPARVGAEHATIAPYGPYTALDDQTLLIAIQNDREWLRFCSSVLRRPELATSAEFGRNSDRVKNRRALNELIAARFRNNTSDELCQLLAEIGIAYAHLNTIQQFVDHPVLTARNRWRQVTTPNGPVRALKPPADISGMEADLGPVPAVGEHTSRILQELGRTEHEIDHLTKSGVV